MWSSLFNTIEKVTNKKLQFHFMHGKGLRTIVLDGSKPQASQLGEVLAARNDPLVTACHETDPQRILFYILRLCHVHFDRYVT
jgi:hypothetical protein